MSLKIFDSSNLQLFNRLKSLSSIRFEQFDRIENVDEIFYPSQIIVLSISKIKNAD